MQLVEFAFKSVLYIMSKHAFKVEEGVSGWDLLRMPSYVVRLPQLIQTKSYVASENAIDAAFKFCVQDFTCPHHV